MPESVPSEIQSLLPHPVWIPPHDDDDDDDEDRTSREEESHLNDDDEQKNDTLAKTRILLEQRQKEVKEMERLFHRYTVDLQRQESMWALEDFACHVLCNHGLTQEERIIAVLKKEQTLNATQLKIYQQQVSQLETTVQELEPIPAKLTRTSHEYNTLLAEKRQPCSWKTERCQLGTYDLVGGGT